VIHFRSAALVLAFVALPAAACRDRPANADPALRDDFGNTVGAGASPRRIVSLNPTTTEILFAIGAGDRMVGRSQFDVFPDAARRVPSLGMAIRPNVEALIAARPDLVILYASADNRPAADRLRQAGIPVVAFKIDSIGSFTRATRLLGRLTGNAASGDAVVDSISATLARVRAATAALPRPTVFIHAWDKPIIAIGGGSFLSELVDIAGARNVYATIAAPSATVTLEDIIQRDPDFILASPLEAARMRVSATWKAVPAVRRNRILVYDTVLVSRPSVQLGAAAVSLARLLHPGAVP
jgi:ABC-type Fe3+-hydroxamate transport system substrate-binding protein